MKTDRIIGMAVAVGMLAMGAFSASAAEPCEKCAGREAMQQFSRETAGLAATLNAKDSELRGLYSSDSVDTHRVSELEAQIRALKGEIGAAAGKLAIHDCGRG